MLAEWQNLAKYLIVKYNDFVVKPEKDGQFERSKYGIGATVKRPGYSERMRRAIVNGCGEKYRMPDAK